MRPLQNLNEAKLLDYGTAEPLLQAAGQMCADCAEVTPRPDGKRRGSAAVQNGAVQSAAASLELHEKPNLDAQPERGRLRPLRSQEPVQVGQELDRGRPRGAEADVAVRAPGRTGLIRTGRCSLPLAWWLLGFALALPLAASAFIERMYSLDEVLKECSHVLVGRLTKIDGNARTAVVQIERPLKGPAEYKHVNMNIALGPAHHARYIMERLKAEAPALVFYQRSGQNIACLVHAGDVWFQLYATDEPAKRDQVWWRFTHVEVGMGRTFNGNTVDLIKLTEDVLAKRVAGPKPDPNVPRIDPSRSEVMVVQVPGAAGATGGFRRQLHLQHEGGGEVRGVSFADVNGDGRLDILVCRQAGNLLLVNQGKGYKEMGRELGVPGGARAAAWADFDGDGRPDLMTDRFQLFRNEGGKFKDESALLQAPRGSSTEGAGWIDYNGDGLPDVFITNAEQGIRLFENTGKGPAWFREVSDRAGLGAKGLGAHNGDFVVFFDFDNDGFADFIYNWGEGVFAGNQRNGSFRANDKTGLKLAGGHNYKRGLAVADFDNDEDLDVFVPADGRPALYRNQNDGTFTNIIDAAGDLAKLTEPSFAAAWGDINGDGHLDLFVCLPRHAVRLYLGNGKGRFTDVTKVTGLDSLTSAQGAAFADLDGDGDLDLVMNLQDKVVVAFNELPAPADRRPVTVQAQARKGLVGAVVRVLDGQGRPLGLRELNGAESCGGQAAPLAHFSLPLQTCRIYMALSDGRLAQKTITVDAKTPRYNLVFREDEFQK